MGRTQKVLPSQNQRRLHACAAVNISADGWRGVPSEMFTGAHRGWRGPARGPSNRETHTGRSTRAATRGTQRLSARCLPVPDLFPQTIGLVLGYGSAGRRQRERQGGGRVLAECRWAVGCRWVAGCCGPGCVVAAECRTRPRPTFLTARCQSPLLTPHQGLKSHEY
jgi:hypothetical protein